MLMNNLDPEVAERPEDLVVYGGTGKAARSWEAFDAIVRSLRSLEDDETLLVQSGKPVAVFRTHPLAPHAPHFPAKAKRVHQLCTALNKLRPRSDRCHAMKPRGENPWQRRSGQVRNGRCEPHRRTEPVVSLTRPTLR